MTIEVTSVGTPSPVKFDLYRDLPVNPSLANGITTTEVGPGTYYIDVYNGTIFDLSFS
jgi:hypothetical protein